MAGKALGVRRTRPGPTDRALATRAALVEVSAELFAERGYLQTSIGDIARAASLTSGAIYGHFRSKAELLAEAISLRTSQDLERAYRIAPNVPHQHVEVLRRLTRRYPERRQLRALILQAAASAVADPETRDRVREEQMDHLQAWIDGYEGSRVGLGIDPSVDLHDAVLYTWAAELGLGMLEAIGITPRTKKGWADMAARFGRSLTLPPDAETATHAKRTPSERR